jgi:hypothetical protein
MQLLGANSHPMQNGYFYSASKSALPVKILLLLQNTSCRGRRCTSLAPFRPGRAHQGSNLLDRALQYDQAGCARHGLPQRKMRSTTQMRGCCCLGSTACNAPCPCGCAAPAQQTQSLPPTSLCFFPLHLWPSSFRDPCNRVYINIARVVQHMQDITRSHLPQLVSAILIEKMYNRQACFFDKWHRQQSEDGMNKLAADGWSNSSDLLTCHGVRKGV